MTKCTSQCRIDRRAGYQGSHPSVSVRGHSEVETYATGCGKISLLSKHQYRQHNINHNHKSNKREQIRTILQISNNRIGTINVQTAKDETKLKNIQFV